MSKRVLFIFQFLAEQEESTCRWQRIVIKSLNSKYRYAHPQIKYQHLDFILILLHMNITYSHSALYMPRLYLCTVHVEVQYTKKAWINPYIHDLDHRNERCWCWSGNRQTHTQTHKHTHKTSTVTLQRMRADCNCVHLLMTL